MIPLDDLQKWSAKLDDPRSLDVFTQSYKDRFNGTPKAERQKMLKALFAKPAGSNIIISWYMWNKWVEALRTVKAEVPLRLLELASGANVGIPMAMAAAFAHPETTYVTANTNKNLTAKFRQRTEGLPIWMDIIEDEAKKLEEYAPEGSVDVVAFEHAVNDIIFDMLARKSGLDTVNVDWFELHPEMIRLTNEEFLSGTLESSVKNTLLGIFSSCMNVLKKGGFIIINYFMYQYDLDKGVNRDFWENLLPIVRPWINEAGIGREVTFEGFDPQWWMFVRKA